MKHTRSSTSFTSKEIQTIKREYYKGTQTRDIATKLDCSPRSIQQLVYRKGWSKERRELKTQHKQQMVRAEMEYAMQPYFGELLDNQESWTQKMMERARYSGLMGWNIVDSSETAGEFASSTGAMKNIVGIVNDLNAKQHAIDSFKNKALEVICVGEDFKPIPKLPGDPEVLEFESMEDYNKMADERIAALGD
tara:strand:- start:484 stop:1062 length:579 start_codon:yes stop_codon:yes gene_type:complete